MMEVTAMKFHTFVFSGSRMPDEKTINQTIDEYVKKNKLEENTRDVETSMTCKDPGLRVLVLVTCSFKEKN